MESGTLVQSTTSEIIIAFLLTLTAIFFLHPIAKKYNLVDNPDQRKKHAGAIPLIGGLSIFAGLAVTLFIFADLTRSLMSFLVAGGILVSVGVIDDRRGLNVKLRIIIEVVAACIMIFGARLWVGNLGNLLGMGEIHMPFLIAFPFTLIAVFGILNAINMIDGIDGAAGGITLISITLLLAYTNLSDDLNTLGPILCGALAGFLICNLNILASIPKVFLGDAGSKLLGLSLVWFTIDVAESGSAGTGGIEPATALYAVGLPLFDMVTTTIRRLKKRISPFTPDRTHIHHICQRAGLSRNTTIAIILLTALTINVTGLMLSYLEAPEYIQFGIFVSMYLTYSYNLHRAFKLGIKLRRSPIFSKKPKHR